MKRTNEKWTVRKINFGEIVAQNVELVHFYNGHFICSGTIKCGLGPLFRCCLHILKQTCARRQRCRRPGRRRPSPWWHCKHETTTIAGRILAILTYCIWRTDAIKCSTPSSKRQLLRKTMDMIVDHSAILDAYKIMSHRLREILNTTNTAYTKHQAIARTIPSYNG